MKETDTKEAKTPTMASRNLVIATTGANDTTQWNWIAGRREFDLAPVYHGSPAGCPHADRVMAGGLFPGCRQGIDDLQLE